MANIILKGIKKVEEAQDPELLDDNTVTQFDNLVLNKDLGKAIKRGGFTPFNTNSAGGTVKSLHDVVDNNGDNYLLATMGTVLMKSANGTGAWSNIKTGLTTGLPTRVTQYADKFIVTNGVDAPFVTDLTNNWGLQIAKPDISTIVGSYETTPTDPQLEANSFYKYILVYIGKDGSYGIPSQPFTCTEYLTASTQTGGNLMFKNLPVSSDPRVANKLLFRTTAGTLSYYLLVSLANDTVEYIDSTPDVDLDLSITIEYAIDINTAKYIGTSNERVLLANINSDAANYISPSYMKADPSPSSGYATSKEFKATPSVSSGGLTPNSTYKYKVIFRDINNLVSKDSLDITIVLGAGENTVSLEYIPPSPKLGYRSQVHRTEADGSVFKFLYENTQSGYAIISEGVADIDLGADLGTAQTKDYSSGVAISQIGQVNHYPITDTEIGLLQVFPDDGDEITGLVSGEYGFIVFKRNSICEVIINGAPINWQVLRRFNNIGCDEPKSIQKVRNIAYFMNNKHIYRTDNPLQPLSYSKKDTFEAITAVHDSAYLASVNWYVLSVTTDVRRLLVYDERLEVWYDFKGVDFEALEEKKYGSARGVMLVSYNGNNYIYKYNESNKKDYTSDVISAEITSHLKTKVYTDKSSTVPMRLRRLFGNYKKKDDYPITHKLTNPETSGSLIYMDSVNSTAGGYKNIIKITDSMTGSLRIENKVQYEIYGQGLEELNEFRLEYREVNRGRRV